MKRTTRLAAGALAAVVAAVLPSSAQEVSVEQLVAIALERSPDLRAARTELEIAGGQVTQAGLRPNPMLSAAREHEPGGMAITGVDLEWPLDLFGRPARVAVARGSADVVALAIRDRERVLASAVREQAGRLLAASRTLDVTNEALAAARRMRELLERRVAEGGSTKIDFNLAAVEALRLEADAALAAGEVEAATIELKALAGLTPDAALVLRDSLDSLAAAPMVPRLTPAAALDARPDVREAIARISLAETRADAARQEARPDVTLVTGYARNRLVFPQFGLDDRRTPVPIQNSFHTYTVGAKVTLPWADRNQGVLASVQAERSGAEELFAARQRAARAEIDAALIRDREARRAGELYATTVLALARENVDVTLEGYDLGRFLLSEVLAEQRRYLDVETGYTAVLLRMYAARTALAGAFGEMP